MNVLSRLGPRGAKLAAGLGITALASAGLVATLAGPAAAATQPRWSGGAGRAGRVHTATPAGSAVAAYRRAADGTLTLAGTYPTGGLGGQLSGSVVDHLASQGSLSYDAVHGLLYAVNAGSDTVSVFAASGDRLALRPG